MQNIIDNLGRDREETIRAYNELCNAIESTKTQIEKLEAKKPILLEQKESLTRAIKLLQGANIEIVK